MFGPLILLAASVPPPPAPANSDAADRATSGPVIRVTATATARIRILSAVSFGEGKVEGATTAHRRRTQITQADGTVSPLELLEFQ